MKGRLIGQYRVTGVLGQGGMGIVYAAQHTLLDRPAAIKVLLPGFSGEKEIVGRFFKEARAATAIRNPGIVEIYDFGWTQEGAAFIVMERLEGETLRARCKRGPLRWSTALLLVRQVAGALNAAHARGIVHRDLKPDNIFLVPDSEVRGGERIKLLDFGIARIAGWPSGPDEHKTRTGAVMGTPTYMAPEQCRGVTVDARADLYAVGCILFELCTGRPPFVGEGEGDVLIDHVKTPPPAMTSFVSGIPKEVESLVQRLLAKAPADRVQTADELIKVIDATTAAIRQVARSSPSPVPTAPIPAGAPESDPLSTLGADDNDQQEDREISLTLREPSRPRQDAVGSPALASEDGVTLLAPAPTPVSSSVDTTTLSSATGTRTRGVRRAPRRRFAIIAGISGGIAIFSALALAFTFLLRQDSDASPQAATVTLPPKITSSDPVPKPAVPPPTPVDSSHGSGPGSLWIPQQPIEARAPPIAAPEARPPPPTPARSSNSTEPSKRRPTEVTLTITSNPPKVFVWSGDFFGLTPLDAKVPRGKEIKIEIKHPGYQDVQRSIRADKDLTLSIKLTPSPPAKPSGSSSSPKSQISSGSASPVEPSASTSPPEAPQPPSQSSSVVTSQPQPTSSSPTETASPAAPPPESSVKRTNPFRKNNQ